MDRRFVVGLLKDWGIALSIIVAALVVWSLVQPRPPDDGPAPEFTVRTIEGEGLGLSDLEEEIVVLNFWATWCGPCRSEVPQLAAFHDEHPDVGLYGISVDEGIAMSRLGVMAKKLGINYTVLHDADGSAAGRYGVNGIPVTFVLDRDRNIRSVHNGKITKSQLEKAVSGARGER